jgi:hypothetical protein
VESSVSLASGALGAVLGENTVAAVVNSLVDNVSISGPVVSSPTVTGVLATVTGNLLAAVLDPAVLASPVPPAVGYGKAGPVGDSSLRSPANGTAVLDRVFMTGGLPTSALALPVAGSGPNFPASQEVGGQTAPALATVPALLTGEYGSAGLSASAFVAQAQDHGSILESLATSDAGPWDNALVVTSQVLDRGLVTTFLLGPSSLSLPNQPAGAAGGAGAEEPMRHQAGVGVTGGPVVAQAVGTADGAGGVIAAPEGLSPQGAGLLADLPALDLDSLGRAVQDLVAQIDQLGNRLTSFLMTSGMPLWLTPLAVALAYEVVRRRRLSRGELALAAVEAGIPTWWFPGLTDLPFGEEP